MSKGFFVLKIFKFLSWLFWPRKENRLDNKAKVDFKIYDVPEWEIKNNYNAHIAQYLKM